MIAITPKISCSFWLFLFAVGAGVAALNGSPQHPNSPGGYYRPESGATDPRTAPPVGYTQSPPVLRPDDYYAYNQYQQQQTAPPQNGGIIAKIKSSIATVGSTLTGAAGAPDNTRGPYQQPPYDPRQRGAYPDSAAAWNDQRGPSQYGPGPVGGYPSNPYDSSQQSRPGQDNSVVKTVDTGIKNMWGKLRSIVGSPGDMSNNNMNRGESPNSYGPYGYNQPGPAQPEYYAPQYDQHQRAQSAEAASPNRYWTQPAQTEQSPERERGYAATEGSYMGKDVNRDEVRSADFVSSPLSDHLNPGAVAGTVAQDGRAPPMYGSQINPSGREKTPDEYRKASISSINDPVPSATDGAAVSSADEQLPPEPQIFVSDGCIVLIPRPVEYFKKKKDIIEAGSQQLNVFSDFERTMTNFRAPNGELSYSTMELLETSNALFPQATAHIRSVIEEYENTYPNEMDHSLYIEMMEKIQGIIAKEGGLQMSYVAPATRAMQNKIALRDGWKDALEALAMRRVPTYIFSSGYGDIITQMLLQQGLFGGRLPPNVRIISNFFRAAPDGSVKGFSKPIVHPGNKNATTASAQMDMPLPERLYALVLGSEEQDVKMTEGAPGVRDTLSVGFLEMTEDLTGRLPTFLNTYDAVVLGDGSFKFCKSLIEELLQLGGDPSKGKPDSSNTRPRDGGGNAPHGKKASASITNAFYDFTNFS